MKGKLSKNSHGSQKKNSQTTKATQSNGGSITVSDYQLYYWAIIRRKDINQWSRKLTNSHSCPIKSQDEDKTEDYVSLLLTECMTTHPRKQRSLWVTARIASVMGRGMVAGAEAAGGVDPLRKQRRKIK